MSVVNPQLDIIYRMMSEFVTSADIAKTIYQGLSFISEEVGAEAASFFHLSDDQNLALRGVYRPDRYYRP